MALRQHRNGKGIDVSRIASAAAEALIGEDSQSPNGREPDQHRGLGSAGAVAVGVAVGAAARAAYARARRLDLEQVASAVEERLKR